MGNRVTQLIALVIVALVLSLAGAWLVVASQNPSSAVPGSPTSYGSVSP
jgi:hypothetical protein